MNNLSKWKISSYLAVIFLAGAVTGGFLGFHAGQQMMFMPPRPEVMAARVCAELQAKLNLTPEQAQKIRLIINDGMVQFQSIVSTDISTTFSNCNARVVVELTPEQQVKFWQIQKEHEKFLHNPFNDASGHSPKTP